MPGQLGPQSVAAQSEDPASTLALYRFALAHRPTGHFDWLEGPSGTLLFRRGDVVCAVNVEAPAVELPKGDLLVASDDVVEELPPATSAWVRTR